MEQLLVPPGSPPFSELQAWAAVFLSWLTAQLIKGIKSAIRAKRFSLRWLFDAGGMPSSHSATVSSLATVIGLYYGFSSVLFLFVGIFTLITMFDAAGVRRNVGRQARILNKMLDEYYEKGQVQDARLKELLGHTPVEVFAGAFLGITLALIICSF